MNDDPIQRFTRLVLFQAQQDHATELIVAPASGGGPSVRYKVGDTWYDMSPPPAHIFPDVITELGRLAAFKKRPFPREGIIDERFGSLQLHWVIRMESAEAACVLTAIEP